MAKAKNAEVVELDDKAREAALLEANKGVVSDTMLARITSFHDAMELLGDITTVDHFDDYGTGFAILNQEGKDRLVGEPFVIIEWRFTESAKYKQRFVSATLVTEQGAKYIINDGSTGICAQLQSITERRVDRGDDLPQAGLIVRNGLRRSDYEVTLADGTEISASTYYLS